MKYKKTIISIAIFIGIIPLVLYLGLLYLYHHPSTFIDLLESTLKARTGLSVSIDNLEWSNQPLQLVAENIQVTPANQGQDLKAHIARFKMTARISGPFAHRILKIGSIKLENFSVRLSTRFKYEVPADEPDSESLPAQILQWLWRVFIFEQTQIEQIDLTGGDIRIRAGTSTVQLNRIEGSTEQLNSLDISGTADIEGLPSETTVSVPDWKLEVGLRDLNAIAGRLSIPMGTIQGLFGSAERVAVEARLTYNRQQQNLDIAAIRLDSPHVAFRYAPEGLLALGPIRLAAAGKYDLHRKQLHLPFWELEYPQTMYGSGQAEIQLIPGFPTRIQLTGGRLQSEKLLQLLVKNFQLKLPIGLNGPMGVNGSIQRKTDAVPAAWQIGLALSLQNNRFDFSRSDTTVQANLSGDIQVAGSPENLHIEARVKSNRTIAAARWWKTKPFETGFTVAASHPDYVVKRLDAVLPEVTFKSSDRSISLQKVRLGMTEGKFNIHSGTFFCPTIQISTQRFKNLQISLTGKPDSGRARIVGKDIGLLDAARNLNLIPTAWSLDARDELSSTLEWQGSGSIKVNGTGKLTDLQFFNADESCLGEGVTLNATARTSLDITTGSLSANLETSADQGEVLCGKHYFDLQANPFRTGGDVIFKPEHRTVQIDALRFEVAELLMLNLNGTVKTSGHETDVAIRLMPTDLDRLFKQLVLEPYQYELPSLNDLLLSGSIQADLRMQQKDDRWAVKGRTHWKNGRLNMPSRGLKLESVNLGLPIWYQAGLQQPQLESLTGRLTIAQMIVPLIPPQALDLTLRIEPNRIRVDKETRLQLKSGAMILGPIDLNLPHRRAPELRTDLELDNVSTTALLKNMWDAMPEGIIRGHLEDISYIDRNLISKGTLVADLFGGQVQITNPGVAEVLSSAPALRLDVELDRLKLADMTDGTSFGRIEGILSGYIRELEIVRGEPQHFDLRLETVKTSKVPQRINVKAVENISRLGGGQSPFMGFAGTFAAMFKAFPYKKIGMAASLNNDIFTINGTIAENGVEYLVRRSGLSGVDVVNLNPDNRISFKDMIKRIQRIQGSQGGPVIR